MATFRIPLNIVNGSFAKLEDNSIDYQAQALSFAIKTNIGELPLEPTFGIVDPTFEPQNILQARAVMNQFWPEIVISSLSIEDVNKDGKVAIIARIGGG